MTSELVDLLCTTATTVPRVLSRSQTLETPSCLYFNLRGWIRPKGIVKIAVIFIQDIVFINIDVNDVKDISVTSVPSLVYFKNGEPEVYNGKNEFPFNFFL